MDAPAHDLAAGSAAISPAQAATWVMLEEKNSIAGAELR
jgi:hypothetical protein